MKKYMILYHAPVEAMDQMQNTTPEQAEEGMKAWMQWAEKCGDQLIDLGMPLGKGQRIDVHGKGHLSEKQVCGFSILEADDLEQAKELLNGHPHLSGWNDACTIELHEFLPMPG